MTDYTKSKIYKIVGGAECYIGATVKSLTERMHGHRSDYKQKSRSTSATVLFDKYGVENCNIELIETFPCKSKKELDNKEGEWIRKLTCVNQVIPGNRTPGNRTPGNRTTKGGRVFSEHSLAYIKDWKRKQYQNNKEYREKEKQTSLFYRLKYKVQRLVDMVLLEQVASSY